MKAFNRTVFALFILLPCLILGYQNCAELSSKDLVTSADGSLEVGSATAKEAPVFVNDLALLNYFKPSDCSADSIDALKLYNPDTNICTEANDSCEAFYLIKNGYSEDQTGNCDEPAHPDDEDFKASLKTVEISSTNFKSSPGQICTMQFAEMVNFKTRECAAAKNGCEISYFAANGFVIDSFKVCR